MDDYDDLFSKHQPDPLLRELNGNVIWYWKPMNPDDTRPGMSSMAPFQAADRIERLETEVRMTSSYDRQMQKLADDQAARIEELKAALREIRDWNDNQDRRILKIDAVVYAVLGEKKDV